MLQITEQFGINLPKISQTSLTRVTEALLPNGGATTLEVKIASIHEGLTRNNTSYTKEGLTSKIKNDQGQESGLASWTKPYEVPVLKNHSHEDVDSTIGRVCEANWIDKVSSEPGYVELTARITNPDAIEKFIRGEYSTGSIGMDCDSAECSICGSDFQKGWKSMCEHERGKWYIKAPKGSENEGSWIEAEAHSKGARRAHVNVGNVWAREFSVVSIPSDAKSKVKSFELKEMTLLESNTPIIDFVQAAVQESVVEDKVVEDSVKDRSVAELMPNFYSLIQEDVLTTYFNLAAQLASYSVYNPQEGALTASEIQKIMLEIESTHDSMDTELASIKSLVLYSESDEERSDSCFALVEFVEGKKLRALPYKHANNTVNSDELLLSLSRANSIATFTPIQRAKAVNKLIVSAQRAKIAVPESLEDKVLAAKEMLLNTDYEIKSPQELLEIKKHSSEDLELQESKKELETLLAERELESDELLEQIADLKESSVISLKKSKDILVDSIVFLEYIEESLVSAKTLELQALSYEELLEKQLEAQNQHQLLITSRVDHEGLGSGTEVTETSLRPLTDTTILAAHFGSKRSQMKLADAIRSQK